MAILLAGLTGFIRSGGKPVRQRLDLQIDRNSVAAEAHHAPASVRGDTGLPGDLAVALNGQGRRIRGSAIARGGPAAALAHAFHRGRRYVVPANCENVSHAV